ncbi:hypothetical protein WG922_03895 [Ramlibacter sp. AN1015]|uniref:hypothetical protein n=1 Tax=Ramlibacter sp. AN1015 TaxID=3133428 RepID=UPI0030BD4DB3
MQSNPLQRIREWNSERQELPGERQTRQQLQQLREWDAQRPNIPGEHWLMLAAGIGTWIATRQSASFAVRLGGSILGSMMVVRAATGRKGLGEYRWLPLSK